MQIQPALQVQKPQYFQPRLLPPPIYTDTESFITTESQYFTDLGYTPETKYVNKYRAKLIISGKDDFELLNTVKQWAKDRNIELEDKTSGSEIKVYCTGSKNYDDGSSIDMAFASTSDNARINLVFFLADPAADQFLADAENVMSSLGIQASSDVGNKASDEGATIAAYDPRANVSIAWSISSLVDENVDKALELCFKWGETFGIPMDDFKIEKANSFLYKASTSVEKGGDKYEIYCYVNDSSKQVLAHIFLYEAAAEQK